MHSASKYDERALPQWANVSKEKVRRTACSLGFFGASLSDGWPAAEVVVNGLLTVLSRLTALRNIPILQRAVNSHKRGDVCQSAGRCLS